MRQDLLRLALVQDNPVVGALSANTQAAIYHIQANKDADLVVFSECFVTGYPLGDLVLRPGFLHQTEKAINTLRDAVIDLAGPAVLIGAPLASTHLPYNAAYLIEPTGAIRIVRKAELPNSDVFDERRTFAHAPAEDAKPLAFRGFNLGVEICEDMWHGRVSRALADELADVLVVINGSPYNRGKDAERRRHARARSEATGLPLIYVNQVGGQDELVFDGGSFTLNPDGATMSAAAFGRDTLHVTLRREASGKVHIEGAAPEEFAPYPANQIEADYRACVLGLRDYVEKTFTPHVFVGVSGGLDSALVLSMAVDALGPERVFGVMMPSRFTSQDSLDLAEDIMTRTGVHKRTIMIDEIFETLDATMTPAAEAFGNAAAIEPNLAIARENYQARLRGMALMGLTNSLGGILLSTGNKSEMAVGYATLYGDMNGGFNPLKSVYKSEAFEMARWRNAADPNTISGYAVADPIPAGIISRPPSAELAQDQEDANSLGDYAALDCVLKSLIEDRADVRATTRALEAAFPAAKLRSLISEASAEAYVSRIAGLVRRAQYKRAQSCPGIKLHPTDFGLGWRYPIAGDYTL